MDALDLLLTRESALKLDGASICVSSIARIRQLRLELKDIEAPLQQRRGLLHRLREPLSVIGMSTRI